MGKCSPTHGAEVAISTSIHYNPYLLLRPMIGPEEFTRRRGECWAPTRKKNNRCGAPFKK
jgi:hypothetical protein